MSEVICGEARFFLISVLTGAVILMGYGLIRAVRLEFPRGSLRMGLEDFLYWTAAGVAFFLVTFWKNSGMLRGFAFVGLLLGMILYYYLLDHLVIWIVSKLLHFLFTPFRFLLKKIRIFTRKTLKKYEKRIKMFLNRVKGKKGRKGKDETKKKKTQRE
ncbi:MAG: spore cortex biosynthesis protein YabQ [Candidatus Limivivens sp.]|nr:spore cortex biosynthesis protein YabQ [Candidatus Limivivens sp.]